MACNAAENLIVSHATLDENLHNHDFKRVVHGHSEHLEITRGYYYLTSCILSTIAYHRQYILWSFLFRPRFSNGL